MLSICIVNSIIEFLKHWDLLGFVIAGFISVIIALIINGLKSLLIMKRERSCVSKQLISSTVYQGTEDAGLKIEVSYNGTRVEKPLSVIMIKLKNDGEEDLLFSQHFSRPIFVSAMGLDVVEMTVLSELEGINPIIREESNGKFVLSWDLLKRDESFYLKVFILGVISDMSAIKFDVRADGIDKIKTPEYRVSETMKPVLIASVLCVVLSFFIPKDLSFIELMPMRLFMLVGLVIIDLLIWVASLKRRIQWMKED